VPICGLEAESSGGWNPVSVSELDIPRGIAGLDNDHGQATADREKADYTETEVAQVNQSHRTGELARTA
jgi:hypothetical protein